MRRFLLILLVPFLISVYAGAATLTDTTSDGMYMSFTVFDSGLGNPNDPDDDEAPINIIGEVIAESTRIPYPSFGGSAIVNQGNGFFDIEIMPHDAEKEWGSVAFSLNIENSSGMHWSDFHFEFYSLTDLINPIALPVLLAVSDNKFDQTNFVFNPIPGDYTSINFWSDSLGVEPGGSVGLTLEIAMAGSNTGLQDGFVIRQIATTAVPIPSAAWLLGAGIVGFAGLKRKFNK